jgi:hypothetical protein
MDQDNSTKIRETVFIKQPDEVATMRFEMVSNSSATSFKSYYRSQRPVSVVDRDGARHDVELSSEGVEVCPGVTARIVSSERREDHHYRAEVREITVRAEACPVLVKVFEEFATCTRDGESDSRTDSYTVAFRLSDPVDRVAGNEDSQKA